ncbi:unnamed protein product [Mytilus edulis]|uniref:COR domain-containing protein n=1 Tax=Mytilus edulis TaxID=6550 RepID=A0A8S3PMN7_MYTED|nr:unnamed protein product [Mytilus edulis]
MKRKKELNDQLDQVLGLQSKYHHLHKKCYLSNLTDTDEEFVKLRHAISETARKMDNWGNAFPLKWILLEHLIDINKNDGKNIINLNDMFKLAEHHDINILEKDELLLFLRFQHNVGNIIFFENIPDLIILKPQWLADAFRCLVSDRIDDSGLHHLEDWTLFTRQGKLSESLITELFKSKDGSQFSGQKNNLHKVMEKLDILVKIENSSYYIMPSQMPSSKFEDVSRNVGILTKNCKRTSWLCFKFKFLPPSFFNHISAWFIKQYIPSKVDSDATSFALYRGICVFDIDISGCEKILVTMSTDTIALQVVSFSNRRDSEVCVAVKEIPDRTKVNTTQDDQNPDSTNKHHISLSYQPWCITEIDSNTVAVSCLDNKTILIINISTRSVTSTINTSGNCGISYNDNNLYVVIVPSDIITDITVDRNRLVCIDNTSIYCCSLDGKVMWKFKMDEIQDLRRVTTDDEGECLCD